jgi:predicted kinase
MPLLVLMNGLPGSGKSTLAERYAGDHPLTLVLDVDAVRGLLGAWLDHTSEAGLSARDLALAMARTHLTAGRDVVVPQFLGRADFIHALARVAGEAGARFVEVALIVDPAEASRRFATRTRHSRLPRDRDAATLLDRSGGLDAFTRMQTQLEAVLTDRPTTRRLAAREDVESVYHALQTLLAASPAVDAQPD